MTPAAPTVSTSPSPTASADTDTAALNVLWDQFWDATTTAYAGPDPSPAIWAGIASDELTQGQVALVTQYVTNGLRYTGAPTTVSLKVTVDGDTADLAGCMDMSAWIPESTSGEAPPTRDKSVYPSELTAQRLDGAWILTGTTENPTGVAC